MRRIFGIGETVLDLIFKNNQPIAAKPGGSVLNALVSLARMGHQVYFISELGDDRVGNLIVDFLHDNHIHSEYIQRYSNGQSSLAMAFLNEQNDASYEFYKPYPEARHLLLPEKFTCDDVLLFGSFYAIDPQIRSEVLKVVQQARAAGALIIYDPNFRSSHAAKGDYKETLIENIRMADVVRGSDEDFANIFGLTDVNDVYNHMKLWCDTLVVTANAKGGTVLTPALQLPFSVPTIEPVSTIGAGDNFNAGIIHAMEKMGIQRLSLPEMCIHDWQTAVKSGVAFSSAVCMSMDNYVPQGFSV